MSDACKQCGWFLRHGLCKKCGWTEPDPDPNQGDMFGTVWIDAPPATEPVVINSPRYAHPDGEAHARHQDPDTSHAAAESVQGTRASQLEALVVSTLKEHGPMTIAEVCALTGKDKNTISPRTAPLSRKQGSRPPLIRDTGTRRDRGIVWEAVECG